MMSTRCCVGELNLYILHLKLLLHCMLTNWNSNKKLKKINQMGISNMPDKDLKEIMLKMGWRKQWNNSVKPSIKRQKM